MAIGDVYRLRVTWRKSAAGNAAINDFYFRQDSVLILDTPGTDLWEAFVADCGDAYKALVVSTLSTTDVVIGKSPGFETEEILNTPYLVGACTGDPMPPVLAGLMSRKTALIARKGRGRLYLPPTDETFNAGGQPSTGYMDNLDAFAASMLPSIGGGVNYADWTPMFWSPTDQVAREITAFVPRGYWATQRDRRKLYGG